MNEPTPEELIRQLVLVADDATGALDRFNAFLLCRLSLLPEWTPELAVELGLASPETLPTFVDQLAEADLIEQRAVRDVGDVVRETFWVRPRRRREVGDYLRERLGSGVLTEYHAFRDQVTTLNREELALWRMVAEYEADPSGRRLMDRVESLLRADDIATAANLVATAEVVGDVIGGTLEDAVKRARWRLDREYRTRDDLDHLRGYHSRTEIEDVLTDLVTSRSGLWGVHLLGNAGVGKTMTVRYLASGRFAADRGMSRFPVARVDFDHLDPRYPERRPAELLVAMTDELLGFATTRGAEHRYRAVRDAADELHEELSRSHPVPEGVESLRRAAIDRFAELLGELPSPVVLVLDTCEELAKLYPAGASAPAIDQTFDLLERLHDQAPQVRVVFAGRRWLVAPPAEERFYSGPRLRAQPDVRVVRMRGFSLADAQDYLRERGVPERLRPVLLARSEERGRYNPFELAGLCDWVRDEPELDPAELAETVADPYVERRILARIQNRDVNAALPVVAAFGRFDRALITPALTRAGVDVAAAFDGLSAQEWVNVRSLGRDGLPRVIEIDEHIRERLRTILDRAPERPATDPHALGRDAAEVLARTPLPEVPTETVVAAVRLLPVGEAAELWDRIDAEILRSGEWGWALQVAPRVAAAEKARADEDGPTILAAILATEASARRHTGHPEGLAELWREAVRYATRHPDNRRAQTYFGRAVFGLIADGIPAEAEVYFEFLRAYYVTASPGGADWAAELGADTVLAALENVATWPASVEFEREVKQILDRLIDGEYGPAIRASAVIQLAGLWLQGRIDTPVVPVIEAALAALEAAAQDRDWPRQTWPDWVVPRSLVSRLRLVRVLVALYGGPPLGKDVRDTWWEDALTEITDMDRDRLLAALVDYELCYMPQPRFPEVGHLPYLEWRTPADPGVSWLHNGFGRPLDVAVADAASLQGRHDDAAEILNVYRRQAVAEGDQAESIDACDLALLRLCRDSGDLRYAPVTSLAHDGSDRVRDEAWLLLRMYERVQEGWAERCTPYGRWRCDPNGSPPPVTIRHWAADHLDFWEAGELLPGQHRSRLPVGAPLAGGRSALMAGEIHMLLGNRELAEPLLSRAAAELTEARYEAGAEKAALLLSPPDPSPAMRSGFGLGWLRAAILGAAGFFRDPRERARRWFAARTWYDIVPALLGTVIVGAILAGVLALVGLPLFWAVLAGVALMALSTFGQIVEPHDFLFKRLVVEMTGDEIEMVVYRHPGRSLLDTGRAGRYQRWRGWLHSYDEPDWAGTCGLEDGTLPDVFPDIRISEPSSTLETVVVLAEIPRDLQFLGPWEHTLGRCYPAKYAARLLWVRQLPGTRGRTSAVDWGRQGEAFHGPVRFRPARWAQVAEGPRRLLHVMGTPVRTVAGWQIRVRDATDASARETSRGAARRETLLDVHELTRDGVGLVVLQAEPVDDPPRPLGADHEGFVRTAMAAADNGANAVVVIPPLPDDLAKDAVETVWSAVTRTGAREVSAVVGLAADLKTMIAKAEQRAGDAVPASSDLLLFLRPVGTQEGPS